MRQTKDEVVTRLTTIAAAGLVALCCAAPAAAQQLESNYTDLNLNDCLVLNSDDFGTRWACPGYRGYPLSVAEGDLRFFLSYGFGAADEPVAEQTLPPFNHLGPRIEWRLSNESGRFFPFATIVRYVVQREEGEPEGEVLVVTRLGEGTSCHVAYVDALANENANVLAQQAADEKARDFDCADAPEIVGEFEAWER